MDVNAMLLTCASCGAIVARATLPLGDVLGDESGPMRWLLAKYATRYGLALNFSAPGYGLDPQQVSHALAIECPACAAKRAPAPALTLTR